jgi:hypothetical protein
LFIKKKKRKQANKQTKKKPIKNKHPPQKKTQKPKQKKKPHSAPEQFGIKRFTSLGKSIYMILKRSDFYLCNSPGESS